MTVKLAGSRRVAGMAMLSAVAITLAACGGSTEAEEPAAGASAEEEGSSLSGDLAGAGATSQEAAMNAWMAGFQEQNPEVNVSYDPTGSGTGREQFLNGAVLFAGSDAAMDEEELTAGAERCFGGEVIELPLYISPIAVAYNLPGVEAENVNLKPAVLADIFDGTITKWNDPAIVADNPALADVDLDIKPINRSDSSGTTENFTEYLSEAAPEAWEHGPVEDWPIAGTLSGNGTSGVATTLEGSEGGIAYLDASRVPDAEGVGTVAVGVGEEFVPFSPEAAAAVVDASPATEDATDLRLTVDLARDTQESGTYPIVLVSYSIACSTYESEQDAENVKALLSYIASEEGQERASDPSVAGSAPISDALREDVTAAIEKITVA
ncbi:phosphate ABC transporter substrate-binding protein PstS [Georgenia sp. AZ-5]|uniref:phosphate ABC transporter substrate-binding protein PstS n=1 Tax=Georgenia sp. AZ-5 TaxID=3367526 RepID=UPI003754C04E